MMLGGIRYDVMTSGGFPGTALQGPLKLVVSEYFNSAHRVSFCLSQTGVAGSCFTSIVDLK